MPTHDWSALTDALLPMLPITEEERAQARADIFAIPTDMTMFSLDPKLTEATLAQISPEAASAYRAFYTLLPPIRPFKAESMRSVILRILREATLMFPGVPLLDACYRRSRFTSPRALHHPQFKVLADAAQGSLREYLFALRDSTGLILSHGIVDVEVVASTHAILHMRDCPWAACKHFLAGFIEGTATNFNAAAHVGVTLNPDDPNAFDLDVRWSEVAPA
jgi:hypothetical protein